MYSYLKPDDKGDPAAKDRGLEKKLDELGKVARDKIEKVFEEFVEKQASNSNKNKSGEEEGDDVNQDDEDGEEEEEEEDEDVEEPSSQLSIQSEEPKSSPLKRVYSSPLKKPKKIKLDKPKASTSKKPKVTKATPVKKLKPLKIKLQPKPSTSYDPEPGEPEPSDAGEDTDEHAEHEKEMEDVLKYLEGGPKDETAVDEPVFATKDSADISRPGSAASRLSVGSVDDLLDDSDGEG